MSSVEIKNNDELIAKIENTLNLLSEHKAIFRDLISRNDLGKAKNDLEKYDLKIKETNNIILIFKGKLTKVSISSRGKGMELIYPLENYMNQNSNKFNSDFDRIKLDIESYAKKLPEAVNTLNCFIKKCKNFRRGLTNRVGNEKINDRSLDEFDKLEKEFINLDCYFDEMSDYIITINTVTLSELAVYITAVDNLLFDLLKNPEYKMIIDEYDEIDAISDVDRENTIKDFADYLRQEGITSENKESKDTADKDYLKKNNK